MTHELYQDIQAALVNGRFGQLPELTQQMAAEVAEHLDNFMITLSLLGYHGRLDDIVRMMTAAWPAVQATSNVTPTAKNEFAVQATDHIIFQYLEQTDRPDAHDAALQRQLERFFPIEPAGLARYFQFLQGEVSPGWTVRDFDYSAHEGEARQQVTDNWAALQILFLGYLRREEGVPFSKGTLVRQPLPEYFTLRRTGQLAPRVDMGDLMRRGRPLPPLEPKEPPHPLCPDRTTLEQFLSRLLHFARPQPYKTAATFELIPAWLRFLEAQALINGAQRRKTMADLRGMASEIAAYWREYEADPALQQAAEEWEAADDNGS